MPRPALAALLALVLLAAGCVQRDAIDRDGTPRLALSAAVTHVQAQEGAVRVQVTVRLANTGDADAWVLPSTGCGHFSVRQSGQWAVAAQPVECARIALEDRHLLRIPAGGAWDATFEEGFGLAPGPATAHVQWPTQALPGDRLKVPYWNGTLAATAAFTVPAAGPAPAPNLALAIDVDTAALAQGIVRGNLTIANAGDAETWTLPHNGCGGGATVWRNGTQLAPVAVLACGKRMSYQDSDLVHLAPGAVHRVALGGSPIDPPGPGPLTVRVTWAPPIYDDDRFTKPVWREPVHAETDVLLA